MRTIHDPAFRRALRTRLESLRPDAQRRFGKMTSDQMMWHVASGLSLALGHTTAPPAKPPVPMPKPLMRFLVIKAPWPKGAPTIPDIVARDHYDFEAERKRALRLIDEMAARDLDGEWPLHPLLGKMSGKQHSELQGKHVDHHLKQFGV